MTHPSHSQAHSVAQLALSLVIQINQINYLGRSTIQEAKWTYFGPKHLKQTILTYLHFIENGPAKLGQHYESQLQP